MQSEINLYEACCVVHSSVVPVRLTGYALTQNSMTELDKQMEELQAMHSQHATTPSTLITIFRTHQILQDLSH